MPAEIVLLQELERWNALVATMSDQLIDLRRALKGEIESATRWTSWATSCSTVFPLRVVEARAQDGEAPGP